MINAQKQKLMPLPDFTPKTSIVAFEKPAFAKPWGGAMPPLHKLPNGELVVDWYQHREEPPEVVTFLQRHHPNYVPHPKAGLAVATVWRREDHPNKALLPPNAPRTVKALYRADVQLAMLRSAYDTTPALDAWESYCVVVREQERIAATAQNSKESSHD